MGKMIQLAAKDGHKLGAYVAEPAGKPRGAMVVLQEIFGVNRHIRAVADRFAGEGYCVVAPALFDRLQEGIELGYGPDDIAEGRDLRAKIELDKTLLDVQAAIDEARRYGKVAVVGYCWGGSLAYLAATRLEGLACAVGYYGGMIAEHRNEKVRVPTILHFGDSDASIPMSDVEKIREAHPDIPIYVYSAGHGFSCDERASFEPKSHQLALERTLKFIAEKVG
ncbi:MAG: dienelactone hydrolase family protein [Rhodospirillales bacterium]|nr:dienelactone hydrolase family protein [Rhodospirillales bacterium]